MRSWFSRVVVRVLAMALLPLLFTACSTRKQSPEQPKSYDVTGYIREIKADGVTAMIQHDVIPGYMEAMTMPLTARDTNAFRSLKANDQIRFKLWVTETDSWIDQIVKIGERAPAPAPPAPARPTTRISREVEPLNVGDLLPNYSLTNHLGQPLSLDRLRGKVVAFTFIFTRCPLPDFCPRMSLNFSTALSQLKESAASPSRWHFLSVSFDPDHDTPAVLKAYGERIGFDPANWTLATGALDQIDPLAEHFGLQFSRSEAPFTFNHNLRTVVLDAAGKVRKVFIGNTWKPEELVAEMQEALAKP